MKGVYTKVYKMSRNEAFAAFALTIAVVAAYSAWGSYILHSQNTNIVPRVAGIER